MILALSSLCNRNINKINHPAWGDYGYWICYNGSGFAAWHELRDASLVFSGAVIYDSIFPPFLYSVNDFPIFMRTWGVSISV